MIFYIALDENGHRRLVGRKDDARAVNKNFEQVDIPTDKTGLMAFVQELYREIDTSGAPSGDRALLDAEPVPVPAPGPVPVAEGYAERAVRFDDEFDNMPLALQLHYAALAMENARERLPAEQRNLVSVSNEEEAVAATG